jgi:hypothetical protein
LVSLKGLEGGPDLGPESGSPGQSIERERKGEEFKSNLDWTPSKLLRKYENLRNITLQNLPNLWPGLEFALSVKTILNIKGCTLPFPGIILGPASSLKTVIIELFRGYRHTFYTDNFSPKSLVSHNSAVQKQNLKEVDMLPKIKNKFFLTPELAPIFASRDDDLLQVLGILTRVADGHGYESDSGAQGDRGYNEEIMFVWLGACVDIPYKVHRLLGTLGPKLYFFRLSRIEETEDYYYNTRHEDFAEKIQEIRTALLEYLAYFEMNPDITMDEEDGVPKLALDSGKDDELADRIIIRLAKLLAHLRALVPTWETRYTQGSDYAYALAKIEDPSRAITQLRNLARGHAVSKGRNFITVEDTPVVIRTALSTATIERVRIFELLLANKGKLTTPQIVDFLNTTTPTALRTMTELKATGLVDLISDPEEYNSLKEIKLKSEFNWFISDKFRELKECKENNPRREPTVSECVEEEGCKENYTPCTPPIFLYDYTINKKLNFSWNDSFHQSDHYRGVHFSLHLNNATGHHSNAYICKWCQITSNRIICYQTSDYLEKHAVVKHPGLTAYPGPADIQKLEKELRAKQQRKREEGKT